MGETMSPSIWILPLSIPKRLSGFFQYGTNFDTGTAVLGDDDFLATLCHLIHELETLGLELRRLDRPRAHLFTAVHCHVALLRG